MLKNKYVIYSLTFGLSALLIVLTFVFQEKLVGLKTWGIVGVFLLNFFSTATIFVPNFSAATVFAGGAVYNPILVAVAATLGGVLGDGTSYLLGKSGKTIFIKKEGKLLTWANNVFQKHGLIVIFLFALIPNPIFDALGIIAGSVSYPFKRYVAAMLAGRFIRNLALAYIGGKI